MISRHVAKLLILSLPLSACSLDSRKQAVEDVIQFGLDSPFEILSVTEGESYLAVADSALADFNRIFDYLPKSEDVDSARYYYNQWMWNFLSDASFSAVENLSYQLQADTLVAEVAVRRPELSEFDRTILSRMGELDTGVLNARLNRAKRELQISDTLVLRVVAGPRIVGWSSAVHRRDSIHVAPPLEMASLADRSTVEPMVASDLDSEAGNPPVDVPLPPDPADSILHFWITQNANIRVGPGMSFEVATSREAGTEVMADSLDDGWYHITVDGGKLEGFIASSLVSLEPVARPSREVPVKAPSTASDSSRSDSLVAKPGRDSRR